MNFYVDVPMTVPNIQNGAGVALHYQASDPNHDPHHSNCFGIRYSYGTLAITNPAWEVDHPFYDRVTATHTKFFFDWAYDGYVKPASLDYSQNCHGFAFGKGDWPDNAFNLLVLYVWPGFSFPCYIPCYPDEAVVAADAFRHSIKVTGKICQDPDIPPLQIPKYITSAEQYATSGIYSRNNGCPEGLNIGLAHVVEKWGWDSAWYPMSFGGYKPAP